MKDGDLTTEEQCQMVAEASIWRNRALKAEAALAQSPAPAAKPIPMLLWCPKCHVQHIDDVESVLAWTGGSAPEPSHDEITWDNPPHRSHLCHACGCIWRPADVATEGVRSIATVGKADTWKDGPAPAATVQADREKVARHLAATGRSALAEAVLEGTADHHKLPIADFFAILAALPQASDAGGDAKPGTTVSPDEIRRILALRASECAKRSGASGLQIWCKANGVNRHHASEFLKDQRDAPNDVLAALGLERVTRILPRTPNEPPRADGDGK
jgi:hypothetical protein